MHAFYLHRSRLHFMGSDTGHCTRQQKGSIHQIIWVTIVLRRLSNKQLICSRNGSDFCFSRQFTIGQLKTNGKLNQLTMTGSGWTAALPSRRIRFWLCMKTMHSSTGAEAGAAVGSTDRRRCYWEEAPVEHCHQEEEFGCFELINFLLESLFEHNIVFVNVFTFTSVDNYDRRMTTTIDSHPSIC